MRVKFRLFPSLWQILAVFGCSASLSSPSDKTIHLPLRTAHCPPSGHADLGGAESTSRLTERMHDQTGHVTLVHPMKFCPGTCICTLVRRSPLFCSGAELVRSSPAARQPSFHHKGSACLKGKPAYREKIQEMDGGRLGTWIQPYLRLQDAFE